MPRRDSLRRSFCGRARRRDVHRAAFFLLAWLFASAPAATAGGGEAERPSFFASVEVRANNLSAFHKWRSALARAEAEDAAFSVHQSQGEGCPQVVSPACRYAGWLQFLDGLQAADRWHQLTAVNRELNRRRYVTDPVNWGVEDYWESPGEFLARDGDCEDFAIAKFLSLRRLGWPAGSLRLAAVRDVRLNVGHAVLVAFLDGHTWMLDNQIEEVTDTERVRDYLPVFSIDEQSWWRHRPRDGIRDGEKTASLPSAPARAE